MNEINLIAKMTELANGFKSYESGQNGYKKEGYREHYDWWADNLSTFDDETSINGLLNFLIFSLMAKRKETANKYPLKDGSSPLDNWLAALRAGYAGPDHQAGMTGSRAVVSVPKTDTGKPVSGFSNRVKMRFVGILGQFIESNGIDTVIGQYWNLPLHKAVEKLFGKELTLAGMFKEIQSEDEYNLLNELYLSEESVRAFIKSIKCDKFTFMVFPPIGIVDILIPVAQIEEMRRLKAHETYKKVESKKRYYKEINPDTDEMEDKAEVVGYIVSLKLPKANNTVDDAASV